MGRWLKKKSLRLNVYNNRNRGMQWVRCIRTYSIRRFKPFNNHVKLNNQNPIHAKSQYVCKERVLTNCPVWAFLCRNGGPRIWFHICPDSMAKMIVWKKLKMVFKINLIHDEYKKDFRYECEAKKKRISILILIIKN